MKKIKRKKVIVALAKKRGRKRLWRKIVVKNKKLRAKQIGSYLKKPRRKIIPVKKSFWQRIKEWFKKLVS
mgnify:CR=1 FL=1